MTGKTRTKKMKHLMLAGCFVSGVGVMTPLAVTNEDTSRAEQAWYKSITPIDRNDGNSGKANLLSIASISKEIPGRPSAIQHELQVAALSSKGNLRQGEILAFNVSGLATVADLTARLQEAPSIPVLGSHRGDLEVGYKEDAAPKKQRIRREAADATSKIDREVRAIVDGVVITPAGGSEETQETGDDIHETQNKWYRWLWPLGSRVEVATLKDEYVPFQTERSDEKAAKQNLNTLPDRPGLMIEVGNGFLDTGNLHPGFEVPIIGAVWQPRLWAYLINRTAIQSFDNGFSGAKRETEIANRLDVFFNLQLTGTEKILLGLRPVDRNRPGAFTRYTNSGTDEGFNDNFRIGLETLFFEGDLGSLFPVLDEAGFIPLDFGFSVGRQPLVFQEGILINDTVDSVGFIRNNIPFPGTSNFRVSAIYGWNRLDRNDSRSNDEHMVGLFTAADTHLSTWNFDLIYVNDQDADGLYGGIAAIQRLPHFGGISTAFRANASYALENEVPGNVVGTGVLLSSEISKTVPESDDIVYFNSFLGVGNFTQAGREPVNGGPLANTGILFASPNLSTYLAEIDPFVSDDVIGGAIGYQAFWDNKRRNLILEIAGRHDLSGNGFDSLGFGFQLQQAVGQHVQLQLEGFYTINEDRPDGSGVRAEVLFVL